MSRIRTAPNRFVRFLRNNLALIIIAVCLLAIITIVIIASVNASQPPVLPVDGDPSNTPVDGDPTGDPTDNPDDPDDGNPTQSDPPVPTVETFGLPIVNYVLGMGYTDDGDNLFVYSSTLKTWQSHRAVDFIADAGTAVAAVKSGVVVEVGRSDGWGEYCIVDHGDGVKATYASLTNVTVEQGQNVAKGDKLGEVSDSALYEFKDGPHLHLAMSLNGEHVDPWDYIELVGE